MMEHDLRLPMSMYGDVPINHQLICSLGQYLFLHVKTKQDSEVETRNQCFLGFQEDLVGAMSSMSHAELVTAALWAFSSLFQAWQYQMDDASRLDRLRSTLELSDRHWREVVGTKWETGAVEDDWDFVMDVIKDLKTKVVNNPTQLPNDIGALLQQLQNDAGSSLRAPPLNINDIGAIFPHLQQHTDPSLPAFLALMSDMDTSWKQTQKDCKATKDSEASSSGAAKDSSAKQQGQDPKPDMPGSDVAARLLKLKKDTQATKASSKQQQGQEPKQDVPLDDITARLTKLEEAAERHAAEKAQLESTISELQLDVSRAEFKIHGLEKGALLHEALLHPVQMENATVAKRKRNIIDLTQYGDTPEKRRKENSAQEKETAGQDKKSRWQVIQTSSGPKEWDWVSGTWKE